MAAALTVSGDEAARTVGVTWGGTGEIRLPARPLRCATLDGTATEVEYSAVECRGASVVARGAADDGRVTLTDAWTADEGVVRLTRHVVAAPGAPMRLDLAIDTMEMDRYFAPGMISTPQQHERPGRYGFADDRLGYPLVAGWNRQRAIVLWVARTRVAGYDSVPERERGDRSFRRDTDLGYTGFRTDEPALLIGWPVAELDRSSQLNARGEGFETFHGRESGLDLVFEYEIGLSTAPTFAGAVDTATARAVRLARPTPTRRRLSLADSIDLRLDSAAKTYTETASGFAGFRLNFDPEQGYDAQAKAFGASFADHEMGGSHAVLEYGFTGRQLDIACSLVERDPDGWAARGRRVVDSFVDRLTHESGWVATLFDLDGDSSLFAIGDPRGTVMHYLGRSDVAGTYTRMMTEAGRDLLRNVRVHRDLGHDVESWRSAAIRLAEFLVSTQNADGSWYRAYAPDGAPIVGGTWFGDAAAAGKSATAAVIPFLLEVSDLCSDVAAGSREAARRAGRFLRQGPVARSEYRGGTLDNPNDVDKEAAFLAMSALIALERADVDGEWRDAAVEAAWFAVGWHSLWAVPTLPGSPVGAADVRSVGWGGINSVWGVGVTDIYSLFFVADLRSLGTATGVEEFVTVADLIAHSSIELLSAPGTMHGFADTGMQPEGISFCDQGRDDGLISKGDTWGGLGWPYTAGTSALATYLAVRDRDAER